MAKVLVVDPDPIVRNYANALLTSRGLLTHQARDAAEARELVESNEYDLVIVDANVGDASGSLVDFMRRRAPATAAHTIVTTTGAPQFSRFAEDFCCATLSKPFAPAEFHRIVELCLDGEDVAVDRQH